MSWLSSEEFRQLFKELKALFHKWRNEDWVPEPDDTTVQEITQAIEKFDQWGRRLVDEHFQEFVTQIRRAIARIQDEDLLKTFTKVCQKASDEEYWKHRHSMLNFLQQVTPVCGRGG